MYSEQETSDLQFRSVDSPALTARYDAADMSYVYTFPNGRSFSMNVPLGGITNYAAVVATDEDTDIIRYTEDGVLAAAADEVENEGWIGSFSANETGSYAFTVESDTRDNVVWETYTSRGSFRIIRKDVPVNLSFIKAPYGFEIDGVYLDGAPVPVKDRQMTVLEKDGAYTVDFYPARVQGAGMYSVSFIRDTTPPYMTFSEDIHKGVIEGTLYFQPSEAGAGVDIYRNGLKMSAVPAGISAGGSYFMEVSDAVGNTREYSFEVSHKRSTPYLFYGALLLFVLFIFVIAYLRARRDMGVL